MLKKKTTGPSVRENREMVHGSYGEEVKSHDFDFGDGKGLLLEY